MTGDSEVGEQVTIPEALHERDQWVCWKEEPRDGRRHWPPPNS
ncbi:hypothetical protein [Natrinema hispanicum]|nr:hypothetical protein [Natrinema hispanicum]